jgi:hypothetical protein
MEHHPVFVPIPLPLQLLLYPREGAPPLESPVGPFGAHEHGESIDVPQEKNPDRVHVRILGVGLYASRERT